MDGDPSSFSLPAAPSNEPLRTSARPVSVDTGPDGFASTIVSWADPRAHLSGRLLVDLLGTLAAWWCGSKRAPKIGGKDAGEFVDGNGQHWDVKAWADTFPAGPKKGQPMPPGTRGRYDPAVVENQIKHELSQAPSENVIVDPQNLSPQALADTKRLIESHPEWNGKVIILDE